MESKEHVAWIVLMLATTIAFVVNYYGKRLWELAAIRKTLTCLLFVSFGAAAVAGIFGAFINA